MNPKEQADYVARGLLDYYVKYVCPVEAGYHFDKFMTPLLTKADFMARPMVLLMGQYSVGKTTFIRYLLGRDFPGARIGPEPTTDTFTAVMFGQTERVIPGNAAAVQRDKPFKALESFGMSFLNRFDVSECSAPLLEHITLIDSPGILSGEKQRIQRGYDFPSVVSYWATRADRILLLFDAHKLDISDEFKRAILALKGNFDKIRCVLNKADQVSQQQLMRIYGALLWSLGKVVQTPEVMRVYISSFWEKGYQIKEAEKLFDLEKGDLLNDLKSLPRNAALRKVNEFVKRTRRAKVHALVCDVLRSKFGIFGKEKKQRELLGTMPAIFQHVSTKHNVPLGDFPNPDKFVSIVKNFEIWKFPALKPQQITALDEVLARGVPKLLEKMETPKVDPRTGVASQNWNPFDGGQENEMDLAGARWVVTQSKKQIYDQKFYSLELTGGKASGAQIKQIMMQSKLSNQLLGAIWGVSDCDKDGKMGHEEFALCMHLIELVKSGKPLPKPLPEDFIPPSFRKKIDANHFGLPEMKSQDAPPMMSQQPRQASQKRMSSSRSIPTDVVGETSPPQQTYSNQPQSDVLSDQSFPTFGGPDADASQNSSAAVSSNVESNYPTQGGFGDSGAW